MKIARGDAVEVPFGLFNVIAVTRHLAPQMAWTVFELENGALLVESAGDLWQAERISEADMPEEDTVTVEEIVYTLHKNGEAQVEHDGPRGRIFALAPFRCYRAADGSLLVYTLFRGERHCLLGKPLARELLRIYPA